MGGVLARSDFYALQKWVYNEGKPLLQQMSKSRIPNQKERSRMKHSLAAGEMTQRMIACTHLAYLALEVRSEQYVLVEYKDKLAEIMEEMKLEIPDVEYNKLEEELKTQRRKIKSAKDWLNPLLKNEFIVQMVKALEDNMGYVAALHPFMVRPLPVPRPSSFSMSQC